MGSWWPYFREQIICRQITKADGRVVYDPEHPKWIRQTFGEKKRNPFDSPSIDLNNAPIADEFLQTISGLSRVVILDLGRTSFGDEDLAHFSQLTRVQILLLPGTKVGGEGLKHLDIASLQLSGVVHV